MSLFTKSRAGVLLWGLAATAPVLFSQHGIPADPAEAVRIEVSDELPLEIAASDLSETEIYSRGPMVVIDLRCRLVVRNKSKDTLRGVTFSVVAQRLAAGGRASVAVPSLNVAPGGTFPARLNLRLLHPVPASPTHLVDVNVDGVLLGDFTFAGPNELDSRRQLTIWEMEAARDRDHFRTALKNGGPEELRSAVLASLTRQSELPRLDARLKGRGERLSEAARAQGQRGIELAFLDLEGAPLEGVSGRSVIGAGAVQSPRISARSRAQKPIKHFEFGWLVAEPQGGFYSAGSVSSSSLESPLLPTASVVAGEPASYQFSLPGQSTPLPVHAMHAYVRQVEFEDGTFWIPSRAALAEASLLDVIPVSAEEQRLTDLYRQKGIDALISELERF